MYKQVHLIFGGGMFGIRQTINHLQPVPVNGDVHFQRYVWQLRINMSLRRSVSSPPVQDFGFHNCGVNVDQVSLLVKSIVERSVFLHSPISPHSGAAPKLAEI